MKVALVRVVELCFGLSCILSLGGCRPPSVGAHLTSFELPATDGRVRALPPGADGAPLTVLVFSAWHCPCQGAHDARLADLFTRYHTRGVDFYAVDSEASGSLEDDAAKARAHGYAFPVLRDEGARLARALRAEYATESFVVDRQGVVRYHGGFDSDRKTLHDDAVPLLQNALDDLLRGRAPRAAETKALGCALQTW
jgi:peroxiredoxin